MTAKAKRPRSPAQLANDARLRNQAIEARTAKTQPRIPHNAKPISSRARQPRAEMQAQERRRRKSGTLNRMAQYKLDVFSEDQLDPDYVYRWVNDENSRLRMVTKGDDYDYVAASEIDGFNAEDESDSESTERVRMVVGEKKNGNPIYSYLLKKRRDFWEDDNRAGQDFRDDVLAGRVYQGEGDADARVADAGKIKTSGPKETDLSQVYVPREAHLEHGITGRRRGPIQP